jgi:threonine/homoserine/homoserine lactone efflux protein
MEYFALGLGFGLAAGLAPGPLHLLVLTTAMQRGFAAGLRVAIAPLLTDLPVVTVGVLAVGSLPDAVVRVLAFGGGVFVVYLGLDALRWRPDRAQKDSAATDLRRGFLANILSPHPWLFWLGVGGPLLRSAWDTSVASSIAFLAAFYLLLVGTKVGLAAVAARGTKFVDTVWYRWLIWLAAGALMAMGIWLIVAALRGTL